MATETLDDLRSEIEHLLAARVAEGLSLPDQRRYEALLLREAELLTCRRGSERGASVVEYGMVLAVCALAVISALT